MVKIKWANIALRDLEHIHKYIAEDSEYYADRLIARVVERADILEKFPLSGRTVPGKEDETIRELIEGNYRIFYKVKNEHSIFILRVHHSAKNIK